MRILITAGPTREPIDPVRYLTNRSSGKMGYALAGAALEAGHEVDLISGPVNLAAPEGVHFRSIETAQEMFDAVAETIPGADVAIFCAAVADYCVKEVAGEKIKKADGELTLTLVKNPDVLGSVRSVFGFEGFLVGFAAETENLEENAKGKLRRKSCDLLVANDVSRSDIGFDQDENEVLFFFADGREERLAKAGKREIAREIIARVEKALQD
ncbi:MAG: phosphopantothenoylcysteine decarboxylase [Verrucomicrobiales bacterium]|nr:phosphopantothenoylcysteine decarboxylase [Verrucomicrobiales bacterium]